MIFTSGVLGLLFLLECLLLGAALYVLSAKERRMTPRGQFIAAVFVLSGGVLYRVDSYLVSYHRPGWSYFPSVSEMLISFGIIALEVLGYVLLIKFLPILHQTDYGHKRSNPSNTSTCPPSEALGAVE